jgi:Holliday junction DNA helicase RuvA
MIGYLKGQIISDDGEVVVLLTESGVGYSINIVTNTSHLAQEEKADSAFYIHTSVSENDISLWGFRKHEELKLFKLLLGVSGVGSRTAQALLRSVGVPGTVQAIVSANAKGLRAPGVGQKTAERIIIDLQSKLKDWHLLTGTVASEPQGTPEEISSAKHAEEAIEAALTLGYQERELRAVVAELTKAKQYESVQELLKDILKHIR